MYCIPLIVYTLSEASSSVMCAVSLPLSFRRSLNSLAANIYLSVPHFKELAILTEFGKACCLSVRLGGRPTNLFLALSTSGLCQSSNLSDSSSLTRLLPQINSRFSFRGLHGIQHVIQHCAGNGLATNREVRVHSHQDPSKQKLLA